MECKFQPGQQVVCVSEKCFSCGYGAPGLHLKSIYTIDWVGLCFNPETKESRVTVTVKECQGCFETSGAYDHACFAPVRETSIDEFKKLLKPRTRRTRELA